MKPTDLVFVPSASPFFILFFCFWEGGQKTVPKPTAGTNDVVTIAQGVSSKQ